MKRIPRHESRMSSDCIVLLQILSSFNGRLRDMRYGPVPQTPARRGTVCGSVPYRVPQVVLRCTVSRTAALPSPHVIVMCIPAERHSPDFTECQDVIGGIYLTKSEELKLYNLVWNRTGTL